MAAKGQLKNQALPRTMEERADVRARILARIKKTAKGCWEWQGSATADGYGYLCIKGQVVRAHRASYAAFKGLFNTKLFICHTCDNPPCVNPEHLWGGTGGENLQDASRKGRMVYKKKSHCKNGHLFGKDNSLFRKRNDDDYTRRICQDCKRAEWQRRKERAKLSKEPSHE